MIQFTSGWLHADMRRSEEQQPQMSLRNLQTRKITKNESPPGTSKRPIEHLGAKLSDILLEGNCGPLLASCFEIVIFRPIPREMVFSKPGAATATFMKLRLFIFESRGIRPMLAAVSD